MGGLVQVGTIERLEDVEKVLDGAAELKNRVRMSGVARGRNGAYLAACDTRTERVLGDGNLLVDHVVGKVVGPGGRTSQLFL